MDDSRTSEVIEGFYDDLRENNTFMTIVFSQWTDDELAYLPHIVMHPSYDPDKIDDENS